MNLKQDAAYEAAKDRLPTDLPGYVKMQPKFLAYASRLDVRVLGAILVDDTWQCIERMGRLSDQDHPDLRAQRGYGELAFVPADALPTPAATLLGAGVMVVGDDCVVGLVTHVVDGGPQPIVLVMPVAPHGARSTVVSFLRSVGIRLKKCSVTTEVLSADRIPGETAEEKRRHIERLLQELGE